MSQEHAEQLLHILDEHVGYYRYADMPARAEEIRQRKVEEFLTAYTTSIPAELWFQGFGCDSVHLVFDSKSGLHLESRLNNDVQEWFDAEVNPLLRHFNHDAVDLTDAEGNVVKGHDTP